MTKTTSSRRWLDRHVSDPYVKRSRVDGFRSRAAYKLLEIQDRDRLLSPGMQVLDLGAAPGSWSQVATRLVGRKGQVIALDLLPIEPLSGVTVLQGDFREDAVLERLLATLDDRPLDLVMSDMAPNMTGTAVTDQARTMYLIELALQLARERLRPGGALLVKAFQGAGFDDYLRQLRADFHQVVSRKPKSSRARSREVYLVAKGLRETLARPS